MSTSASALNSKNSYKATGTYSVKANKTLVGETPKGYNQFTFNLYEGDKLILVPKTRLMEQLLLIKSAIRWTDLGNHTYTLKEASGDEDYLYDTTVKTVSVNVSTMVA